MTRTHPFVGIAAMGGPAFGGALGSVSHWDSQPRASFLVAIRAGLLVGRSELAVDVSPFSYSYYQPQPGPTFLLDATYGYLIPVAHNEDVAISWPLRVGAGFFAGNVGGDVYFQLRADLLGLVLRFGRFTVDAYLPSFRYAISNVNGETPNLLSWEFGAGTTYLF